ncbi:MAG: tripartite tricarboxylate transporter substrate binding protein [Rubrivivax sp.]|nr:tripartite tricarboxylate transporter substrate binding protein [Rubrivivax sp.]
MIRRTLFLLLAALPLAPLTAVAQDKWPSKPIEIIYPFPPGNDTDAIIRVVAEGMSKRLGVPVQVINKPGGGGVVGFAEMVRAKPDGYTIGTWQPGPGISQIVAGNTPYKQSDYQALAGLHPNDFVLAARGNIPAKNLKEFGAWAKQQGKPIVIGSYAPAAVPALIAAKIARQDGWPYKVVAFPNPSAKELVAGDADLSTTGADMVASYAKDGQVKVISAWSAERNPVVPATPTAKEEGYGDLYLWSGMAAPAGVPKDIIARLSAVIAETLKDKPVLDVMKKLGVSPMPMTPEQMAARVAADTQWVSALMTELGLAKK